MVNCINLIIEMSPRFILGRENVPCVAEVVNRSLKADCTNYNSFNLFHAPGGGYIIFYNSCPLSDTSIVCEKCNYKQLNFLSISTNFLFVAFNSALICKYEGSSLSLYLVYVFIFDYQWVVCSICEILLTLGTTFPTFY